MIARRGFVRSRIEAVVVRVEERSEEQVSLDGINRRGERVRCTIRISSLQHGPEGVREGLVMLMETESIEAEQG
jgi:hypothetical protein